MRTVLHILTEPAPDWVQEVIQKQQADPSVRVEVMDLSTSNPPDYSTVLDQILAAESVSTW